MSHCSRKNQMRCVERTFLCPSSSSCFDRSKSYREASKIANGRANSPSPQKTRRRVLCSWNTKRHDALCMGRRAPQICAEDLLVVCVSFFSRWFFFSSRFRQKQPQFALFFVCVDARQPSKRGKSLSYSSVSPPFKLKEEKEIQILFFCLLVRFWNSMIP